MKEFSTAWQTALDLVLAGDPALVEIVTLSLQVSTLAVTLACIIGFPTGALLGVARFPGRAVVIVVTNALLALPPVVVGLGVYLLLSGAGPLGALRLLYTPTAMIMAQTILVTPIVIALTRQLLDDLNRDYDEQLRAFGLNIVQRTGTLLIEARAALVTVALIAFGRAIAEVGAVIIVGGNINHVSRVMTTAIALETSRGELALALALGLVLLLIALAITAAVTASARIAGFSRHA